jgi:hypothetical protein
MLGAAQSKVLDLPKTFPVERFSASCAVEPLPLLSLVFACYPRTCRLKRLSLVNLLNQCGLPFFLADRMSSSADRQD